MGMWDTSVFWLLFHDTQSLCTIDLAARVEELIGRAYFVTACIMACDGSGILAIHEKKSLTFNNDVLTFYIAFVSGTGVSKVG